MQDLKDEINKLVGICFDRDDEINKMRLEKVNLASSFTDSKVTHSNELEKASNEQKNLLNLVENYKTTISKNSDALESNKNFNRQIEELKKEKTVLEAKVSSNQATQNQLNSLKTENLKYKSVESQNNLLQKQIKDLQKENINLNKLAMGTEDLKKQITTLNSHHVTEKRKLSEMVFKLEIEKKETTPL